MKTHLKDHLNLHFIVFIWGFTAILGKYISVSALDLVFNRTGLTALAIGIFLIIKRRSFKANSKDLLMMWLCGVLIAVHWITFFGAIKIANVSITLAGIATGALWSAILGPLFHKAKIEWSELSLGLLVVSGIAIIFYEEPDATKLKQLEYLGFKFTNNQLGLLIALFSAALSASFSLFNQRLVQRYPFPVQVTFYEIAFAFVSIGIYEILFRSGNPLNLLPQSTNDWIYLLILALLCTAYPFIMSVELLKRLSAFSVMLAINLEPVYGILLAAALFGASEAMNPQFYAGVLIILGTVVANGIIKARKRTKRS